jgi:hypothetical protein
MEPGLGLQDKVGERPAGIDAKSVHDWVLF